MVTAQKLHRIILKYFIISAWSFLLFNIMICAPLWTRWPTGFYVADFAFWVLTFVFLIGGTYLGIRKIRERRYEKGIEPPPFSEILFYIYILFTGFLMGGVLGYDFFQQDKTVSLSEAIFMGLGALGMICISCREFYIQATCYVIELEYPDA